MTDTTDIARAAALLGQADLLLVAAGGRWRRQASSSLNGGPSIHTDGPSAI